MTSRILVTLPEACCFYMHHPNACATVLHETENQSGTCKHCLMGREATGYEEGHRGGSACDCGMQINMNVGTALKKVKSSPGHAWDLQRGSPPPPTRAPGCHLDQGS